MVDSPHDKLFKEAFGSVPAMAALLRSVLPAGLAARLELGTLKAVPGSFTDAQLAGSESDLVFSVELGGRPALDASERAVPSLTAGRLGAVPAWALGIQP